MNVLREYSSKRVLLAAVIAAGLAIMLVAGCATAPKEFDPTIKGPQMIVEPDTVSTGVVSLLRTPLLFRGKGFDPGDSVFVTLVNVNKGGKTVHIPIADGEVDKNGHFTAKVGTLVKVAELLNAKLGSNKKLESIVIVSRPPIPPGTYTARAVSMESDKIAVCKVTFVPPGLLDRFKDWVGKKKGKIVFK
ncbi:MAG: hypothetical protein DRN37_02820 [Thermoplasmata archaeon]|nr:MAG: hypothetical protein DRN37_02820 [Thermoplasmata archaeon]